MLQSVLNANHATVAALLDAAPDTILVVSRSGHIVAANRQSEVVFGYAQQELIGEKIELLIPEALQKVHVGLRDSYFAKPHTRPMGLALELYGRSKSGALIPVEISLSPVTVDDETLAVAIVRDVTESMAIKQQLQRQATELMRSNRELEQFAYVASHDLQEPLRMISGYIQLLQRRYRGKIDADADQCIDFSIQGVKRMQTLIADLMTYSRVTTAAKPLVETDLNEVLEQALANLQFAIEEASAEVVVPPLPLVIADPVQMIQLFQNLIGNGVKFRGADNPRIVVDVREQADHWDVCVSDNGIGINPAFKDKIFVIFQRGHTTDKYPGTGIGLAICKKIVERHGGEIWVESKDGAGARFCFSIPKRPQC